MPNFAVMPIRKLNIKHCLSDLVAIVPVAYELFNAFNFLTAFSWYSLVLLLAWTKKLITLCCFCLMVAIGGSSLKSDSPILEF